MVAKICEGKIPRTTRRIECSKKSPSKLEIEVDELWSFVGKKHNKQWVWLALNKKTREIIGFHVGGRGREDARKFWQSLPPVYRQ